jgi:molecular chaperone DnaK (HSP70)
MLKVAAEKCKCNLTHMQRDNVHIDNLINGIDLDEKVTRVEFEFMCEEAFNRCFDSVDDALTIAKMQPEDITDIILVGGSSVIPKIKEMITTRFNGKKPVAGVPAEEAVALGAAIFANQLVKPKAKKARKPEEKPKKKEEGPRPKIKEEAPPKVVIEDDDEEEDDDDHGIRIIETASYSIGVRKQGGEMQRFIERGTILPAKRTFKFQPVKDNVDHAYIKVYEGERPLVKNNRLLTTCKLCDLPKKPACEVTFDITISVASDGTTKVSAELAGTKQEWNIESSKGRLSEEEIAEQIAIAEKFKEIDEAKVQYIRVVNEFQSVCNTLKRNATKKKDPNLKLFASEQILWIEDLSEVPDGDPAYILAQAHAIRERLAEIQKKL